jgi:uncharacterized protein YigA (DUF484 family)
MIKKKKNSQQIIQFLSDNPNYFVENPELLKKLKFPLFEESNSNKLNIVSFKDWIIKALKVKQKKIITNAHLNFLTQTKIHSLILEIIRINKFETLLRYTREEVPEKIGIDCALVVSSSSEVTKYGGVYISRDKIEGITRNKKTIIMDAVDQNIGIFDSLSYKVYSNALCVIDETIFNSPAFLAFGSKEKIFINNKGSDLISFFAEIYSEHCKRIKSIEKI